ncbi:MAG: hypothetical protein BRD45_03575 [Bacteroidetes bacterium QS_8_64_10]|nr:MAG: hypothetical protein BRD45_03575 [Bacteroidetes bacterium QS_8_64_10]
MPCCRQRLIVGQVDLLDDGATRTLLKCDGIQLAVHIFFASFVVVIHGHVNVLPLAGGEDCLVSRSSYLMQVGELEDAVIVVSHGTDRLLASSIA